MIYFVLWDFGLRMRHVSEILVPGFGRPVLLCGARCLGPEGWLHTYEMVTEHFVNPNLSVIVSKCWFSGYVHGVRQNICVESLPQPWPRLPDFWLFTSVNGCRADWRHSCLFPVCWRFEWPSSIVVGFYHHEPSRSCCFSLCNCLLLRSVGFRPNRCTWWNTWPRDDWCPWPSEGCCCSTDRKLRSLLSVGSHFDGSGGSKLM